MKFLFTLILTGLLFINPIFSADNIWDVDLGIWNSKIDGNISWEDLNVDLDSNLNLDDDKSFNFGLSYNARKIKIRYNYLSMEHSAFVNIPVQFNNINFNLNADMNLDVKMHEIHLTKNFYNKDNTKIDYCLGAKIMKIDADVTGTETGTGLSRSISDSVTAPIPFIGFAVEHKFTPAVKGFLSSDFIRAKVGDTTARMSDTKFGVTYYFLNQEKSNNDPEWGLTLGYRSYLLGASLDDTDANPLTDGDINFSYKGIFYALNCRF